MQAVLMFEVAWASLVGLVAVWIVSAWIRGRGGDW